MAFKSFRFRIIIRLLLLCLVFWGVAFFQLKHQYYFTTIELLVVAIILVIELIFFVERGYQQLNGMLYSVKEKDFNISFSPLHQSKTFSDLAQLLNDLTEGYRSVRIEKEVHYQFINHVVDQISQAIICFDSGGNVSLANIASRKLLKSKRIKNISDFNRIDSRITKLFWDIAEGQESLITFMHNGELNRYTVTCSSIKLQGQSNKLIVMHDIHQPLQEQELESYRKLIRVLTHEIMNSVTPILSLSQAMSETLRESDNSIKSISNLSDEEAKDLAEGYFAIEVRSKALMRFVKDFRSLTKLPTPNIETINIDELMKPVIALLKPTLDQKGISISLSVSKGASMCNVDRDLIEQVLINLIKNAIEALGKTSKPKIEIEVDHKATATIISIKDNGMGISETDFDKVFVPFYSTKPNGSGIGLSLSQQIMRLHNGNITFKSTKGTGSVFSLTFPN